METGAPRECCLAAETFFLFIMESTQMIFKEAQLVRGETKSETELEREL